MASKKKVKRTMRAAAKANSKPVDRYGERRKSNRRAG